MKAVTLLLLFSVLCLPVWSRKVAILIGCNGYKSNLFSALHGCVEDVKQLQQVLKRTDFQEVYTMTDGADLDDGHPNYEKNYPSKSLIEQQLPAWANGLGKGDTLLLLFSGHGVRADDGTDDDYLVPLDAREVDVDHLVKFSWVLETLRKSGAENIVIITDACRSYGKAADIGKGFGKAAKEELQRSLTGEKQCALLRSCSEEECSYELPGGAGGIFAHYIALGLSGEADGYGEGGVKDGVITAGALFAYAKEQVGIAARNNNEVQTPQWEAKGELAKRIPLTMRQLSLRLTAPKELADGKELPLETDSITIDGVVDDVPGVQVKYRDVPILLSTAKDMQAKALFHYKITSLNEGVNTLEFVASDAKGHQTKLEAFVNCLQKQPRINPKDHTLMLWIPTGTFQMGNAERDNHLFTDDKPAHQITLDGFWMYQYDVTVRMYREFCLATGRTMPMAPEGGWQDEHPIVNVSWNDANAYAKWAGASLPTEAEWERAARGGDDRPYVWGAAWPPPRGAGNFADDTCKGYYKDGKFLTGYADGFVFTAPVGSFAANPYKLYDMAGNVWQWCADWYAEDYYLRSPATNPLGPETGVAKVLRGGAWSSADMNSLRVTRREWDDPTTGKVYTGFRCVVRPTEQVNP